MSIDRARQLRSKGTAAERKLWAILRPFRDAYHFRRQVQIGPYYADIASFHANLVIEADGITHTTDDDQAYDDRQDHYLQSRGFRILRLWNDDILESANGIYQLVAQALANVPALTPTPVPSPQGGGRRKNRRALADLAARTGPRIVSVDRAGPPPPCGEGTGVGGNPHRSTSDREPSP